ETLLTLGLDDSLNDKRLSEIGVPYFDVLTARGENSSRSYCLYGDRHRVLAGLDYNERSGS
ncbi:MAG: hypothetical protein JXR97_05935, partial [Planctomycetes bacterium]|nr:hypothetical protein [Planctomycetota bacterium]